MHLSSPVGYLRKACSPRNRGEIGPFSNGYRIVYGSLKKLRNIRFCDTQQVKCVPLLPVHNQFACLEVENENPSPPSLHAESPVKVTPKSTPYAPLHLCQWEKHLPKQYVVAAAPGPKSLIIKVEIQTTDTAEVKSGPALIDCRATGQFMDCNYVEQNRLTTRRLQHAIPVFNVDRSPNEAGSITEIIDVILRYKGHMEHTSFAVTSLGKQVRKEHWECQRVEWLIWVCHSGPHPLLSEEESEVDSTPDSNTVSDSTSVRGLLVLPFISSFYFPSSYFPVSFPFPLVPTLLFPYHSQ